MHTVDSDVTAFKFVYSPSLRYSYRKRKKKKVARDGRETLMKRDVWLFQAANSHTRSGTLFYPESRPSKSPRQAILQKTFFFRLLIATLQIASLLPALPVSFDY